LWHCRCCVHAAVQALHVPVAHRQHSVCDHDIVAVPWLAAAA
jgi:hypothetical protein